MSIELILCLLFMLVALPVSKSIAVHYLVFAAVNVAALGIESVDSSALSLMFASLAIADAFLIISGGRLVLLSSAIASVLLCIESIANMDWLLSQVTYVSAAVNAVIAANLAKEYLKWTNGKYGH